MTFKLMVSDNSDIVDYHVSEYCCDFGKSKVDVQVCLFELKIIIIVVVFIIIFCFWVI